MTLDWQFTSWTSRVSDRPQCSNRIAGSETAPTAAFPHRLDRSQPGNTLSGFFGGSSESFLQARVQIWRLYVLRVFRDPISADAEGILIGSGVVAWTHRVAISAANGRWKENLEDC